MYKKYFKRVFDLCIALVLFLILLPLFIVLVVVISIVTGDSPFFLQLRPGKNKKLFRLVKFKSMNEKKDVNGYLLPDAQRFTSIGLFIRKTSLDEIPQLLNVIKGDMSLIGPRPLLVEYLSLYNSFQARRHEVLPGISGWAQVNGRNSISWKKKFEYDIYYVDNVTFVMDMRIILLTLHKVFRTEGVNEGKMVTMEKFIGNT